MKRVEGKIALVTGAASGIGRACALALAGEGARVIVADIDETEGEACAREIGGGARFQRLDVSREEDWASTVESVRAAEGALHLLVNNAAICIATPVLEMSFDAWRRQQAVNLDSVFLGCRAAIPLIAASGGGAIVNIASVAGLQGIAGLAGYCASKGGVRLFTKALALECAQAGSNIRVNAIYPGGIETPIWVKMANGGEMPPEGSNAVAEIMERTRAAAAAATPIGFAGLPEDIAEGVLYLCSPGARFVTGAELVIDGGASAG